MPGAEAVSSVGHGGGGGAGEDGGAARGAGRDRQEISGTTASASHTALSARRRVASAPRSVSILSSAPAHAPISERACVGSAAEAELCPAVGLAA